MTRAAFVGAIYATQIARIEEKERKGKADATREEIAKQNSVHCVK